MSSFLSSILGSEVENTAELRGGTVVLGRFSFLPQSLQDSEIYRHFASLELAVRCVALEGNLIAVCSSDVTKIEEIGQALLVLFLGFCVPVSLFSSQISGDDLVNELASRAPDCTKQSTSPSEPVDGGSDLQFDSSSEETVLDEATTEAREKWNELSTPAWQRPVKRYKVECGDLERALEMFQEEVEVAEPTRFKIYSSHACNAKLGFPEISPEIAAEIATHAPIL